MKRLFLTTLFFLILGIAAFSQTSCDTLNFESHGSKLIGYFYPANQPRPPTLIFTQGFMDTGDIWGIGDFLSKKGINVFMFDFRGCFESEGQQGLMNSQEDIGAALAFVSSPEMVKKYEVDTAKIVLGGYSYGGHMSMLYAVYHPEIKRVISISGGDLGAFASLISADSSLMNGYAGFFESIRKPKGPVTFQYDAPLSELLQNQDYFSINKQAEKLARVDILMTGGLDDSTVSLEDQMLPLYRSLKKNKEQKIKFLVYQTNHSYKGASEQLKKDVAAWIKL